jgi:epoxyqueuosine reductase
MMKIDESERLMQLAANIKAWARSFGFTGVGITDTQLTQEALGLKNWLAQGFHGSMDYMARNTALREDPALLVPNTIRIISVRMPYLPPETSRQWQAEAWARLAQPDQAYISVYARGRDYHKVLKQKLQALALKIQEDIGVFGFRVFTDSAPVMEVALAQKAQLGWRGKHSLLLTRQGSMHFLGEIFTDLPLPVDDRLSVQRNFPSDVKISQGSCGKCTQCIDICPTKAIVAPGVVDARRCISYLTIESKAAIPIVFRKALGNRIYGCDDCQLICPWNKFAMPSGLSDFRVRHQLDQQSLVDLFSWDEATFLDKMAGSPIRRIGFDAWLRNIAVGLGNAATSPAVVAALQSRLNYPNDLVKEHVVWALGEHGVSSDE